MSLDYLRYFNPFYILILLQQLLEETRKTRILLETIYESQAAVAKYRNRLNTNPITSRKPTSTYLDVDWREEISSNPYNEKGLELHDPLTLKEQGYDMDEISQKVEADMFDMDADS